MEGMETVGKGFFLTPWARVSCIRCFYEQCNMTEYMLHWQCHMSMAQVLRFAVLRVGKPMVLNSWSEIFHNLLVLMTEGEKEQMVLFARNGSIILH